MAEQTLRHQLIAGPDAYVMEHRAGLRLGRGFDRVEDRALGAIHVTGSSRGVFAGGNQGVRQRTKGSGQRALVARLGRDDLAKSQQAERARGAQRFQPLKL